MGSSPFSQNPPGLLEKLENHIIGIAGCGGLGSNIALMLARAGIQHLIIADYDKVEISNLNRQHYFQQDIGKLKTFALKDYLIQINPDIKIEIINKKLQQEDIIEQFFQCSIIVEAFDNVESKAMIINAFGKDIFKVKYLVTASGLAGIESANSIKTKQIAKNIYACGDFTNPVSQESGLTSSRVMVVAAHQTNIVLRLLFLDNINTP